MPPKSTKKTAAKVEGKGSNSPTAPLRDMIAYADQCIEIAAIVRATAQGVAPRFVSECTPLPALLLRRPGAGARAASIEAVMEANSALEGIARQFEQKARDILDRPVELTSMDAPEPSDFPIDEVVEREKIEYELNQSRRTTAT